MSDSENIPGENWSTGKFLFWSIVIALVGIYIYGQSLAEAERSKKEIENRQSKAKEKEEHPDWYMLSGERIGPQRPQYLRGSGTDICKNAGIILRAKDGRDEKVLDWMLEKKMVTAADYSHIISQTLYIGGNECLIYAAWGDPQDINTTTNQYGTSKQYVYKGQYVYTDDGIIKTIQQ